MESPRYFSRDVDMSISSLSENVKNSAPSGGRSIRATLDAGKAQFTGTKEKIRVQTCTDQEIILLQLDYRN